jgi:hypothetical protein
VRTHVLAQASVSLVLRTLHHVLAATLAHARTVAVDANAPSCADLELRLVQCANILITPPEYDLQVRQM